MSVCLSVYTSKWKDSSPSGRIFMKFDVSFFFENPSTKFNFIKFFKSLSSILIYDIISLNFLREEIFHKPLRKSKTHVLRSISFLPKSCRLRDNVEKYSRACLATDCSIIRRLCITCLINSGTYIQSEYATILAYAQK
jgi:hypothetical protein